MLAHMSTPIFPLVDRIMKGELATELAARRAAGDSYSTIARWLEAEHGVSVTNETVRKWCIAADVEALAAERTAGAS